MPRFKLTVETIPPSTAQQNVRTLRPEVWDLIRREVYSRADYKCQICGEIGGEDEHSIECHEVWNFNIRYKVQKLIGFQCLCPLCHSVKHIYLANLLGHGKQALEHLKKVNHWSDIRTRWYMSKVEHLHNIKSFISWQLNISYVDEFLKMCDIPSEEWNTTTAKDMASEIKK